MEDAQIVELFFLRDEAAVLESGRKYGAYCFWVANSILKSREDSEECVNDTWLKAWQAVPPERPNVLKMYFAKITRRLSFDKYRRRSAKKRGGGEIDAVLGELSECIAGETDAEDSLLQRELAACVNSFLEELSEKDRSLFLRRYFFSEPLEKIACDFGVTGNYVSVRLTRCRKALREHLKKEGYFV